jgi:aminotransferase in exopolysaccharide biosynthesis
MTFSDQITRIVREAYGSEAPLPLHAPVFTGNERDYVLSTIESTFVSSVGAYVDRFEAMLCGITGAGSAVATSNGTSALFVALLLAGVVPGDLVLTQSLTFVATANAISHAGAQPVFLDIERPTLGMNPDALETFFKAECNYGPNGCVHRRTGRRVSACVPMHTFGLPCRIDRIVELCDARSIVTVEDAAEALGSTRSGRHCGTFGRLGVLSFNGNKICTTGGGGAILTDDAALGKKAKHLTTTAKLPHPWRFEHDMVAYNFRMPNLNAALGCAQLEQLDYFITFKRALAERYRQACFVAGVEFVGEPADTRSNYWLNAIIAPSYIERKACLEATNRDGVMTRSVWEPMHRLPMFRDAIADSLVETARLADLLFNVPSGVSAEH